MKRKHVFAWVVTGWLAGIDPAAALEVHEWGTFTILHGSDGRPITWYQPQDDLAHLPDFVTKELLLVKAASALVRMETPVIYFYPDEAGPVTVEATFRNGRITETFPAAGRKETAGPGTARWSGRLVPPDDPEALAVIPPVARPAPDEPYEAARQVPDAWIFRPTDGPDAAKSEKFIFYRGSGMTVPPVTVRASGTSIAIVGERPLAWTTNVALEVTSDGIRWAPLQTRISEASWKSLSGSDVIFSTEPADPEAAVAELVAWFQGELTRRGLTADEAAAMIATWRTSWFREKGLRVFSLVPQAWVDEILPLTIEPEPRALKRVFVARHELLSPAKENALLALVSDTGQTGRAADFSALDLGRFANGAFERVLELQGTRMRREFSELMKSADRHGDAFSGAF